MEMMHFARNIHAKSVDLSKDLVEFKSNGNCCMFFECRSWKRLELFKKLASFKTFNCKQFFFKNHQYVQTSASISK